MTATSFSVIIPARNAAATIGRCLDSVNRLDTEPAEIIVVDDASTDETAAIASSRGARVIREDRNVGSGLARNSGAAVATSDFVAFTDADCEVPPDWLDRFRDAVDEERYSGISGPYAGATDYRLLSRMIDHSLRYSQKDLPAEIEATISSNLCVKRSDFQRVGGFPAYRLPFASVGCFGNEDDELGHLLVSTTGKPIRWLRDNGVYHGYRPTLRKYLKQQAKYAEAILVSYARFPAMITRSSNYSRGGGATKALAACMALAGVALTPITISSLAGVLPFVCLNLGCVRHLVNALGEKSRILSIVRCYGFLFLTQLAWTKGLAVGGIKALIGLVYWRSARSLDPQAIDSAAPFPA